MKKLLTPSVYMCVIEILKVPSDFVRKIERVPCLGMEFLVLALR